MCSLGKEKEARGKSGKRREIRRKERQEKKGAQKSVSQGKTLYLSGGGTRLQKLLTRTPKGKKKNLGSQAANGGECKENSRIVICSGFSGSIRKPG